MQPLQAVAIHRRFDLARRRFAADFVSADRLKADGLQNMDPVDHPADRGLPVDRFEDAASGRGGHHVVGDAFDLQLGACKAGMIAPNLQSDSVCHGTPLQVSEYNLAEPQAPRTSNLSLNRVRLKRRSNFKVGRAVVLTGGGFASIESATKNWIFKSSIAPSPNTPRPP